MSRPSRSTRNPKPSYNPTARPVRQRTTALIEARSAAPAVVQQITWTDLPLDARVRILDWAIAIAASPPQRAGALRNFALMDRQLGGAVRKRAFTHVVVRSEGQLERLVAVLEAAEPLGALVRTVRVVFPESIAPDAVLDRLWILCPSLVDVTLHHIADVSLAALATLSNLRRLALFHCTLEKTPADPIKPAGRFKMLTHLAVINTLSFPLRLCPALAFLASSAPVSTPTPLRNRLRALLAPALEPKPDPARPSTQLLSCLTAARTLNGKPWEHACPHLEVLCFHALGADEGRVALNTLVSQVAGAGAHKPREVRVTADQKREAEGAVAGCGRVGIRVSVVEAAGEGGLSQLDVVRFFGLADRVAA